VNGSELVVDIACRTGEGPLWHPEEACLYWMDIPNGALHRHRPGEQAAERVLWGPVLGAATLQRDGAIALFGSQGRVLVWRDGSVETILDGIGCVGGTRFNDAIADPSGSVISGTMPTAERRSVLVRVEPDGRHRVVVRDLAQSNGMAFSEDGRTLYHVDTRAAVLRAYDYDAATGEPRSPRLVKRFDETDGKPDGMAADEEGFLWIALWGGGCVVRIDPVSGREAQRIRVATPLTSSVAFGGDGLSELYITTAGGDDRAKNGAFAGSVFGARPGVRGRPRWRSALRLD
jgi:D-xylonolactonase